MKKQQFIFEWQVIQAIDDLPEVDRTLLEHAHIARNDAYSPYSRFKVGAALLLSDGTIVKGNNQENMAYPSGLCAERVAMFWAGANHSNKKILAIAITASSVDFTTNQPVTPCGACRQAMLEYEIKQLSPIKIIMQGAEGEIIIVDQIRDLLPLYFHEKRLGK
ncbi:MAG: cytidine deaminase [Flavobacteriales bacterium]